MSHAYVKLLSFLNNWLLYKIRKKCFSHSCPDNIIPEKLLFLGGIQKLMELTFNDFLSLLQNNENVKWFLHLPAKYMPGINISLTRQDSET